MDNFSDQFFFYSICISGLLTTLASGKQYLDSFVDGVSEGGGFAQILAGGITLRLRPEQTTSKDDFHLHHSPPRRRKDKQDYQFSSNFTGCNIYI